MHVAGLDGCRAGWFVVTSGLDGGAIDWFVAPSLQAAWERIGTAAIVGIDIPVGIPDAGPREADRLARQRLSPWRSSSVFPAPIRPVLHARSHQEACERREAIDGRRMSVQAFHILGKIAEVDTFLQSNREARHRVREVHPELAFATLNNDAPMRQRKRDQAGFDRRLRLLAQHVPVRTLDDALVAYLRKDVARDDVLDAFAVMLTARRIAAGQGSRVPDNPDRDATGIDMAIWY